MTDREKDGLVGRQFREALRPYVRRAVAQEIENPTPGPVPEPSAGDYVYFIEATGADLIKIGRTRNVGSRLKQLQTGTPHRLELLGSVAYDGHASTIEARLHEAFAADRVIGEWFRATPEIRAAAEEAASLTQERRESALAQMPQFARSHEEGEAANRRGPWTKELRLRAKARRKTKGK